MQCRKDSPGKKRERESSKDLEPRQSLVSTIDVEDEHRRRLIPGPARSNQRYKVQR